MAKRRREIVGMLAGLGLCMSLGCQTWEGGMTLPSPHYLRDNPDYIQPAPQFPLSRELANMQKQAGDVNVAPVPTAPYPPTQIQP